MRRTDASLHDDDAGLTLIELIVGIVVSTIVLIGVGTIMINSWLAQNDVLSTTEATNRGQFVSSSIERAMRNALDFEVRAGGSQLWVHTTYTDHRECQAFQLTDGVAEMKMGAPSIDALAWGRWLDAADYSGFEVDVNVPGTGAFAQSGDTLEYDFSIATDSAPVQFSGEASIRAGEEGSGGCWS